MNKIVRQIDIPKRKPEKSKPVKLNAPKKVTANVIAVSSKPQAKQKVKISIVVKALVPFVLIALGIGGLLQGISYSLAAKQVSKQVLGVATSAYEELDSASQNLSGQNFDQARLDFKAAQASLTEAQTLFDKLRLLGIVAPQAKSADNILSGAYFLAEAGKSMSSAMSLFDELKVNSGGVATENFADKLKLNLQQLKNAQMLLTYASDNFNNVSGLPSEYDQTVSAAKSQIAMLQGMLNQIVGLEDLFVSLFGDKPKTYLLVFQNYDELRATGGFIGTYGVLKYDQGQIKKLKIESVYNIDGSLNEKIAAPGPFQPDIKKWAMRDANFFLDFPTSANKLLQFFEMESETADGVIAITPRIFEQMLELVGPIPMPEYAVTLTSENFQEVVQQKTSYDYDKVLNQPKKFLNDFAPRLLDRLSVLQQEQWISMLQILQNNLHDKSILMYSNEKDVQDKIASLGFDGSVTHTDGDYLAVVNSNHGGTKTDLDILQNVNLESRFGDDGKVVNKVTVTRVNTSEQNNLSFMRVLVPYGSSLVKSSGFMEKAQFSSESEGYQTDPDLKEWDKMRLVDFVAVRSETGKTAFTGWVQTESLSTSTIELEYVLPFTYRKSILGSAKTHSVLFQKQPGAQNVVFSGTVNFGSWKAIKTIDNSVLENNQLKFSSDVRDDMLFGAVIKP